MSATVILLQKEEEDQECQTRSVSHIWSSSSFLYNSIDFQQFKQLLMFEIDVLGIERVRAAATEAISDRIMSKTYFLDSRLTFLEPFLHAMVT